jgi:thiaminase/transcriptional activator TenA
MDQDRTFTQTLWHSIQAIYTAILDHPFIRGLTDGSLPEECFRFYAIQDALYLVDFARALALLGARAPAEEAVATFSEHAAGAIKTEKMLHQGFFQQWGLTPQQVYSTPMAPTNLAYTSYLLRVCYSAPFHEALGAVLPCYWIYWEVGKHLLAKGSPHPIYRRWIDTYGGEEFGTVVKAVLDLADAVGGELTPVQKEAALRHFVTTSRYEWMFWDMGYRKEAWPL